MCVCGGVVGEGGGEVQMSFVKFWTVVSCQINAF